MPKSKTRNQSSKQHRESIRHQKTSRNIVDGLLELAFAEDVLLSIHQETDTPEGAVFTHVASLCEYVDEDDDIHKTIITDGIKTVDHKAFINLLTTKLASKDKRRNKLSAIYFEIDPEAEHLGLPEYEEVLQWEIANGTIVPDNENVSLWEPLDAEPGFPFEDGGFEIEEYSQDYSYGLEVSERFFEEVITNTPNGHHVITMVCGMGGDENVAKTIFVKDEDILDIEPDSFVTSIRALGSFIETELPVGLTLRSFTEKTSDDEFEMDSSPQEVRGWSIIGEDIEQLSVDDLITAYCTDAYTGKLLSPEPYVRYCDMWELEDG